LGWLEPIQFGDRPSRNMFLVKDRFAGESGGQPSWESGHRGLHGFTLQFLAHAPGHRGEIQTTGGTALSATVEAEGDREVVATAFPRARPETARSLVVQADIIRVDAGRTALGQDEQTRTLLVLEGHLGLRRTAADGREVIMRIVSTGQLASLLPIAGRPAALEALALSPARVALWSGSVVEGLAQDDVGLALDLFDHLLVAFQAIVQRLDGLIYQDAVRRVARVLEQYSEILFGDDAVLSRTYLPGLIGTSHEMTARVLRKLESDGVVARDGRDRLQLLDSDHLARIAAAGDTEQVHGETGYPVQE
jgi:CRP-like cAMP-binding protein